jgi:SAM-dependent methyltransferase
MAGRSLQSWLQERQYSSPYHWRQRGNDRVEYQLRTRVVLEFAGLTAPVDLRPRLLDVGCGDARFAADATRWADTIGVDVSHRALGFARRLATGARFVACGAEALALPSNSFDIVTLLDVIEHIHDDEERFAIAEARRVLRPGGRLVISTNTDLSARELKHFRHYPVRRFERLFEGFTDVRMLGLIPYFPMLRYLMAAPLIGRLMRSRVRTCHPSKGQVIVGVGRKPHARV